MIDILERLPGFDSFIISLQIAGLIEELEQPGRNLTVAATEEAYDRLDRFEDGARTASWRHAETHADYGYHMLEGTQSTAQLATLESWETNNGQSVMIESIGG